jgi:hypothetical protein
MSDKKSRNPARTRPSDPVDDAVPIDDISRRVNPPTDPTLVTALDDDEGGADAVDPDTGKPYRNRDAGVDVPAADRTGGSDED